MRLLSLLFLFTVQFCTSVSASISRLLPRSESSPLYIPPSQNWDGDDGPWSSFTLQVGTPIQDVRVFLSAASADTWVVRSDGCSSSEDSCTEDRGRLFNPNSSSTWIQSGSYDLGVDQNMGYSVQGQFGNDTLGLGLQGSGGPVLKNQIIAAYTNSSPYVGVFGLNPSSTNFSATDQGRPSYLTSLKEQNKIPSLSFGYTAGNQYRLKQVYGSLILGGYDASLFTPNPLTIGFAGDDLSKMLQLSLQGITAKNQNGSTNPLLPTPITVNVDSTVAMIWLPTPACKAFESAFGLSWDDKSELYLVDDDLHSTLLEQNANVTFTISNQTTGGRTADITLPYQSFDLLIKPPYSGVNQSQRYFPLKRSADDSQNTLGRTFLQEAYLIVDWERRNFSLSQCQFSTNAKQKLTPIHSPGSSASQNGLSTGAKAGIAIAVVILVLIAALTIYLFLRHQQKKRLTTDKQLGLNPAEETIRRGYAKGELYTGLDNARYEMEGSDGNALRPYGGATPPWVNEKAQYPGLDNRAEADSADASPRAELNSPTSRSHVVAPGGFFGGRGVHEMYDASSIPPIELPGDRTHRREMEGSTPSDSPRPSPGRAPGSLFSSHPSSPLSRPQSSKPSPGVSRGGGLFGAAWRRDRESSSAGAPSSPSSRSNGSRDLASPTGVGVVSPAGEGRWSPVSRRGTFSPPLRRGRESEREGAVFSPISPASTEDGNGDGIFRGFGRRR